MDLVIRGVKKQDLDALVQIEAVCFPAAEAAKEEAFRERIAAFPENFLAAELDGRVVGFINGCVTNEKTISDEMYEDSTLHNKAGMYQSIFGLDVLPQYQKKGIAGELMKRMIQKSKEDGRKGLILTCKESLISFYEKFGYKNCGVSESVHGGAVWYDMILEF